MRRIKFTALRLALPLYLAITSAAPAQLPNAWQISDNSTASGSTLAYLTNVTAAQKIAATNSGWRYTVTSRLTTDFGGIEAMFFIFGDGTRRFGTTLDLDASGHLVALPLGESPFTLTTNLTAATNYHVHEFAYDPTTALVTYQFDGVPLLTWTGQVSTAQSNIVQWGASSSGGRAEMNFHQAQFEIVGEGVIASYLAGFAGNPANAPSPTTQGWTRSGGATAISEGSIAPDVMSLPPEATTLPAAAVLPTSTTFGARLLPAGRQLEYTWQYGLTTNYGNTTVTNEVPAGIFSTNVSINVANLMPGTTYQFRVQVVNSLGIASFGENLSFTTPAITPNAWQIDDGTINAGVLQYQTNLTPAQVASALTNGWRYSLVSRMISDSGSAATHSLAFGDGTRRFYVFFDLDGAGQLTAQLLGDNTYTLAGAATATNYFTHELIYNSVTSNATYRVNGAVIALWPGQISVGQANQVMWGANSSTGRGVMNFHRAEFEIPNEGIIASYHAGFTGSPAVAPAPTTQGWLRFVSGLALPETALSPDVPALPEVVTTLAATALQPLRATLNAMLQPDGLTTDYYFEHGLTTNYGSFTSTNTFVPGGLALAVNAVIENLAVATTYHFRAVASNSAGIFIGPDRSFTTTSFYALAPGVFQGAVAWGDFDNDGWLDLVVTGADSLSATAQILRNTGTGFTNSHAGLPGVSDSSVAWGDYDNDGRLDLLLAGLGTNGLPLTQLWRNTGSGFSNSAVALPGISEGGVAWANFDNDGRLDLVLTGATNGTSSGAISQIWRNTGAGFENINAGLPGLYLSAVACADFDADGRVDLALSGFTTDFSRLTQIWRNTGNSFSNLNAGLPGVYRGALAWGDADDDGRLDLLLAGDSSTGVVAQVWRNTGSGFTNSGASLPGFQFGTATCGDYDNDGGLDVLLRTQVYRNTGTGFTQLSLSTPDIFGGAMFGDADNDGRLDVLLAGDGLTQVRLNTQPTSNTPPGAPAHLNATFNLPTVRLSWSAASDNETPASGLTYNLRVGTTPGGTDIVAPHADAAGQRRLPAMGNAHTGTNALLLLPAGTYYWSVQTIDGAFGGSPFAPESSFTVPTLPLALTDPATELLPKSARLNARVNPNTLATTYYFEYGLTTNYGNFTVTNALPVGVAPVAVAANLPGLTAATTYHFRVVAANASGSGPGEDEAFSTPSLLSTGLPQMPEVAGAWGDFDGDGRLDLLAHGRDSVPGMSDVWRNTGAGFDALGLALGSAPFVDVAWSDHDNDGDLDALVAYLPFLVFAPASLELWRNLDGSFGKTTPPITALGRGSLAWGDYDNDGRKDLLIAGVVSGVLAPTTALWGNTGGGFSNRNASLPGVVHGAATWADFDGDGLLDFVLTGATNTSFTGGRAQIWRHTGSGFTPLDLDLPGVFHSAAAWGDYDNDGRLDLLLAGTTDGAQSGAVAQIWRNTGVTFTNLQAGLPGVFRAAVGWGDYDNDGRLDVLLAGTTDGTAAGAIAQIWRNTGTGFSNLNLAMPGVVGLNYATTALFGDTDNDGRLDVFLAGTETAGEPVTGVWLNDEPLTNTPPGAPSSLQAVVINDVVQLNWQPAPDLETPALSLSYNLRVGTTPGGSDIVSAESRSDGFRFRPALGNTQLRTNAALRLQPGSYYWSVQAVDGAYAGGTFAPEASFVAPPPGLSLALTNGEALISWTPTYPGWILQEALSLSPTAWTNSPSGATNPVIVPVALPARFYRLFKS